MFDFLYFTIKQRNLKKFEISIPISFFFWLFWCETGKDFPWSKSAAFQTYDKKHRIKILVIWVQIIQLHRYTIAVITWLYLNARMRISKAMRKQVEMLTFFTQDFLLVLGTSIWWCDLKRQSLPPMKNQKFFS